MTASTRTHNRLDTMHRHPPLSRILKAILVGARRVEDRDADLSIFVDVGVPHLGQELHLGRVKREVLWEGERRAQEGAFVERIGGSVVEKEVSRSSKLCSTSIESRPKTAVRQHPIAPRPRRERLGNSKASDKPLALTSQRGTSYSDTRSRLDASQKREPVVVLD